MTGYEALRTKAAVIDLSSRTKILVTGEDRHRLLHALSTNHVRNLAENQSLYAFFLNAQGRILADAWIHNLGDRILLDSEPELREKLLQHIDKYIIAEDVVLEDVTDQWAAIGIEGPGALSVTPPNIGIVTHASSTGKDGLRIFVPHAKKTALLEALQALPVAAEAEARTVRIENGVARYGEEITERFLVQETGALHAVHFTKGCYLGQEIVERVRSRAQVHRHLTRLIIHAQELPAAGTKLQADGKDAAEIVSAVHSPALNAIAALAYVRTEALDAKPELTGPNNFRAEINPA